MKISIKKTEKYSKRNKIIILIKIKIIIKKQFQKNNYLLLMKIMNFKKNKNSVQNITNYYQTMRRILFQSI
jgi:hypothetical protein